MKTILITLAIVLSQGCLLAQSSCADALEIGTGLHDCEIISGEYSDFLTCAIFGFAQSANWFIFTAQSSETLLLTTSLEQNLGWDSRIQILTGTCDDLICFDSDDDGGVGTTSDLNISVTEGTTYYIVFDDRWTDSAGQFYLGNPDDVEGYLEDNTGGGGGGETPETLITFEASPFAVTGSSECVVDMNGDYLDDIVATNQNSVNILYQQADGSFISTFLNTPTAEFTPSWSIAAGDLDGNGFNDLLYGDGSGVSIMMRSDEGDSFDQQYASEEYVFSQRSNMVDINNDGILDAFVCHDVAPNVFFISDGEGGFEYFQGGLGDTGAGGNYGSIWIDYNNDCLIDMFIAKCRGGDSPENINQMHRNNGDGTFTEVGEEIGLADNVQTWSSAWADYDNDGDMDVFIGASSTFNGSHKLMRNDDGIFVDVTADTGILSNMPTGNEHTAHDYNNDGYVDIDIAGNTMLLNNGDMTFTHSNTAVGNGPVGDLNNDGYLDIISAWGGDVYYNMEEGNNYLKVNTIGVESNKNGIGARVTVESALGSQIRDIKSGDGFAYMSSLTAHFGIGQDTEIYEVTVHWPSGNVTVIEDVQINQTLNVVEIDDTIVSVNELLEDNFTIFPNPTSDYLNVSSDMNFNNFPLEVMDLNGRVVVKTLIKDNRISLIDLSSGTYIARISANGANHQVSFIKE